MALTSTIDISFDCTQTNPLDLQTPTAPLSLAKRIRLLTGVGADQADMIWTDTNTLAASGTTDIDLAGSLTGAFGTSLTFARIKVVYFSALSTNTNNVNVTRPASNGAPLFLAAGDGIPVRPDGCFLWVAPGATGIAVTGATGDLITVTNSGGTTGVTYSVVIIGASS